MHVCAPVGSKELFEIILTGGTDYNNLRATGPNAAATNGANIVFF